MQLYLIRHAQSENNARPPAQRVEEPALTHLGHEQSHRLARRVADLQLDRVVCSPFLRALETAEHVRRATGLSPHVRIALHEKGGCVAGTRDDLLTGRPGMTRGQIADRFPHCRIAPDIDGQGWWGSKPPETLEQSRQRAERLWHDTCAEYGTTNARIAYVLHGDFLLLLLSHIHAEPLNLAWNASLTRLSIDGERVTLEEYSCVRHLPGYLVTW